MRKTKNWKKFSKDKRTIIVKRIISGEATYAEIVSECWGSTISTKQRIGRQSVVAAWVRKYKKYGTVSLIEYREYNGKNKSPWTVSEVKDSITKEMVMNCEYPGYVKDYVEWLRTATLSAWKKAVVKLRQLGINKSKALSYLKLPRSSFYGRVEQKQSRKKVYDETHLKLVEKIYNESLQVYGRKRICVEMNKTYWIKIGEMEVYGMMKKLKIKSLIRVPLVPRERRTVGDIPDLIKRRWISDKPMRKLYTDVSYIKTKKGFYYISVIIDGYNNECVGWSLSEVNDWANVKKSLQMAKKQFGMENSILHYDHSILYFGIDFKHYAKINGITGSSGRVGISLDNRAVEFFFSILKYEFIFRIPSKERSLTQMNNEIREFMSIYNRRRQSTLMNLSPVEFRKRKLVQERFYTYKKKQ